MILELFGPSGAGKTTLAFELVSLLRSQGYPAALQVGDRTRPVRRIIFKFFGGLHSKCIGRPSIAAQVLKVLPPKNELWAIRLNWHLEALIQARNAALASDDIVAIFDQGMVQSICSLVLLSGITDRKRVAHALDLVPKPDLLIRLQAPLEVLEARLRERRRNLGVIQRLLELDLQRSLSIDHIDLVSKQLESCGHSTICVESLDSGGLVAATELIATRVRSLAGVSGFIAVSHMLALNGFVRALAKGIEMGLAENFV
jgi:thymidylate kinase